MISQKASTLKKSALWLVHKEIKNSHPTRSRHRSIQNDIANPPSTKSINSSLQDSLSISCETGFSKDGDEGDVRLGRSAAGLGGKRGRRRRKTLHVIQQVVHLIHPPPSSQRQQQCPVRRFSRPVTRLTRLTRPPRQRQHLSSLFQTFFPTASPVYNLPHHHAPHHAVRS